MMRHTGTSWTAAPWRIAAVWMTLAIAQAAADKPVKRLYSNTTSPCRPCPPGAAQKGSTCTESGFHADVACAVGGDAFAGGQYEMEMEPRSAAERRAKLGEVVVGVASCTPSGGWSVLQFEAAVIVVGAAAVAVGKWRQRRLRQL